MSELKAAGYKLHGEEARRGGQVWYILTAVGPQGRKLVMFRTLSFTKYCGKVQEWLDATEEGLAACDPEATILEELADMRVSQKDIALTYAHVIAQDHKRSADWPRINRLIRERWTSAAALGHVKKMAWKHVNEWKGISDN